MLPAFLLPLLGGAAAGMGLGALTSEDGFSDDGWWQGLLGGAALGGLGGAAGLLGGPASIGGSAALNPLAAGITTGATTIPSGVVAGSGLGGLSAVPAAELAATTVPFSPGLFGGMGGMMSMPSNDTLMKGLLGSMVFKNVMPGQKQQQPGSISRGQRAAPFQPRQPIMFGGGRPQRRSFRR